jgi:hypothetical protein
VTKSGQFLRAGATEDQPFGRMKQIGRLDKVKLGGVAEVHWLSVFGCEAYNLLRIPKLRGCAKPPRSDHRLKSRKERAMTARQSPPEMKMGESIGRKINAAGRLVGMGNGYPKTKLAGLM